ncbi:hypothetical protein N7455_001403 [Penicillium solitum]|uniref:uncharacterized protein n=1 Tax=Penicillium solitum TaxID=60172 RepID=UPI0032C438DC|nr:hypothetical protein N7536_006117 [Penicillium majusculum]KAJ5877938.1 hypothetical protein N7455_001403 [Penicillium solitum]
MIAGIHHHPRSLNLFLVFLSVNVGVFFSFFRSELANRFFLCMAFALFSTFILSFDFLLISSQLYWADDEMT